MLLLQLKRIFHIPDPSSLALNVNVTPAPLAYVALLLIVIVHVFGGVKSFHKAAKCTVAPLVEFRFLNNVANVLAIDVSVVVSVPYVCITPSISVIFHPMNVYHTLVGLLTVKSWSYVAVSS